MESPYSKLKVVELKEYLAARGLPTSGLKKELVMRLEEAQNAVLENCNSDPHASGPVSENDYNKDVLTGNYNTNIGSKEEFSKDAIETAEILSDLTPMQREDIPNMTQVQSQESPDVALLQPKDLPDTIKSEDSANLAQIDSKMHKSAILKVSNFVRPFTLSAVQELLSQSGTVITFWMDHLRTQAFVEYDSLESAELSKFNLHGIQWPLNVGRHLSVEFTSAEMMNAAMNAPVQHITSPIRSSTSHTLDDLFLKTKILPHIYYLPRNK